MKMSQCNEQKMYIKKKKGRKETISYVWKVQGWGLHLAFADVKS